MNQTARIPETCSIAFKEWAGVCEALGSGRQSLILRKGGVSEGLDGFHPDHPAFWLYPTFVHEAEQGLRSATRAGLVETPGFVAIEALAVVEWFTRISTVGELARLEAFHDWTEASLLARFHYRTPGLWAIVVQVFRRSEPWSVAITPAHLGCKTWVPLETPPPTTGLAPVLDADDAAGRLDRICSTLSARDRGRTLRVFEGRS
jgi:hypothetical protein